MAVGRRELVALCEARTVVSLALVCRILHQPRDVNLEGGVHVHHVLAVVGGLSYAKMIKAQFGRTEAEADESLGSDAAVRSVGRSTSLSVDFCGWSGPKLSLRAAFCWEVLVRQLMELCWKKAVQRLNVYGTGSSDP